MKRPVLMPLLLSKRRFACVIACELCAHANSGVFPMAKPLFSGLMPLVCVFRRVRVSPNSSLEQFSRIDNNACVAQLLGTRREIHFRISTVLIELSSLFPANTHQLVGRRRYCSPFLRLSQIFRPPFRLLFCALCALPSNEREK